MTGALSEGTPFTEQSQVVAIVLYKICVHTVILCRLFYLSFFYPYCTLIYYMLVSSILLESNMDIKTINGKVLNYHTILN